MNPLLYVLCFISIYFTHYSVLHYYVLHFKVSMFLVIIILIEGCKAIASGVNVMDLRNNINKVADVVITDLKSRALMSIYYIFGLTQFLFYLMSEWKISTLLYWLKLNFQTELLDFRFV
ncbi:hypothetical protein QN277_019931 [Acacia crassicarpa]|uniref:Uncharacterized protein n=1 Tax=Acacia crassicarpa TaxID=499986 RepID=A0AAE1JIR6_9FABA|nr:hypothetical protein QN277_019931 [Acacia crassicarpa]